MKYSKLIQESFKQSIETKELTLNQCSDDINNIGLKLAESIRN